MIYSKEGIEDVWSIVLRDTTIEVKLNKEYVPNFNKTIFISISVK